MKKIFFLLCLLISINGFSQKKEEIRLNLKKGASYVIDQKTAQEIVQNIMGTEQEISQDIEAVVEFTVTDARAEDYSVDIVYKRMKMVTSSAYFNMTYDSEQPAEESDAFASLLNNLLKEKSQAKINKYGEITEYDGFEEAYEKSISQMNVPEENKAQLRSQLAQTFSDESQRSSLEAFTAFFPKEQVAVKGSWKKEQTLSAAMPMTINTVWTYEDKNKTAMSLIGKSDIKSLPEQTMLNGMPAKVDINGTQTTNLKVDPSTGWVISGETNSDISGNIAIESPQVPGGSMEIPIHITTKTTFVEKK